VTESLLEIENSLILTPSHISEDCPLVVPLAGTRYRTGRILTAVLCLFFRALEWYAIKYYYEEAIMSAITATEARKSLFGLIQQVNDDHTVVEVVSRHGNAVILSKDDYDAITETAHLLRNPANAERLLTAIERVRRGEFEHHDLITE